ncbi:hypothetical protein D1007_04140 [Hordeum vulgare]|nr:hypothetical protein D1007_04140 [Hordeum vulgare]
MFRGLEWRECRALGFICRGSVSSPLVPDEDRYLDLFTKVVQRLEAGDREVGGLIEEERRNLLSETLTRVFSNLFHTDPHFNFEVAMVPILEANRDTLGKVVRDHVDTLSTQFAPDGFDCQGAPRPRSMKMMMMPKYTRMATTARRVVRLSSHLWSGGPFGL